MISANVGLLRIHLARKPLDSAPWLWSDTEKNDLLSPDVNNFNFRIHRQRLYAPTQQQYQATIKVLFNEWKYSCNPS